MIPDLTDALPLETQLRQARRSVCVPGNPNDTCVALVGMSLRLAADPSQDPKIREEYATLQEAAEIEPQS